MMPLPGQAKATFPEGDWRRVLVLSRLVVAPTEPTNAASYLVGRSIRLIRADRRFDCLVTYADEWQGHQGTIYKATNWSYCGTTAPEETWLDPRTGKRVARRRGGTKVEKSRNAREMQALGYISLGRHAKHKFRIILRTAPEVRALRSPQMTIFD